MQLPLRFDNVFSFVHQIQGCYEPGKTWKTWVGKEYFLKKLGETQGSF